MIVDLRDVTRLEVIDQFGRSYVNHNVADIDISLQDTGKTLKLFVKNAFATNEWDEKRMDVIGQNGNDGNHY